MRDADMTMWNQPNHYEIPRGELERMYREVLVIQDAHGVSFEGALDMTEWAPSDCSAVLVYRADEYA